jgi:hypothetical protein
MFDCDGIFNIDATDLLTLQKPLKMCWLMAVNQRTLLSRSEAEVVTWVHTPEGRGVGGGGGCSHQHIRSFKSTEFVYMMIGTVLRDLSVNRNQPMKLVDD